MKYVTIIGNTYPVRDRLKALGGRWNAAARGWDVPADREAEARAIVPARATRSIYTRFNSGAEVYVNARGRCEDAPCCGCCS